MDLWGRNITGRGQSRCKGPEVSMYLACCRKQRGPVTGRNEEAGRVGGFVGNDRPLTFNF